MPPSAAIPRTWPARWIASARRCRGSRMARRWSWRPSTRRRSSISSSSALGHDRALVVLVFADGHVENRIFTPPPGPDAQLDARGGEFPQRADRGQDPVGAVQRHRDGDRRPAARRSTSWPVSSSKAGSPSGTAIRRQLRALIVRGRRICWTPTARRRTSTGSAACSTTSNASATSPNSSNWPMRARACAFLSARRTNFSHFRVPLWSSLLI